MPPKQRNSRRRCDKKRKRTILNNDQLMKLEKVFKGSACPERHTKQKLCKDIEMPHRFVNTWFQNRRAKDKREREFQTSKTTKRIAQKQTRPTTNGNDNVIAGVDKDQLKQELDTSFEIKVEHDNEMIASEVDISQSEYAGLEISVNEGSTLVSKNIEEKEDKMELLMAGKRVDYTVTDDIDKLQCKKEVKKRPNMRTKPFHNKNDIAHKFHLDKPSPPAYGKIISTDTVKNGSGEPDDNCNSAIQDLLKLTNNINNQMNWGTFGMTSTIQGSAGLKISECRENSLVPNSTRMIGQEINGTAPLGSSDVGQTLLKQYLAYPTLADTPATDKNIRALLSQTALANGDDPNPPTLFRAIINMMAIKEGGIMSLNHAEFDHSVNDSLYGIRINNSSRLVYSKEHGLDLVEDITL